LDKAAAKTLARHQQQDGGPQESIPSKEQAQRMREFVASNTPRRNAKEAELKSLSVTQSSSLRIMIRPQYHFRQSPVGLLSWDVRRLIRLSADLPIRQVPLTQVLELDENHWYSPATAIPSCRSVVEHCALIIQSDLSFPVILDQNGRVMHGMHRICKALMQGIATVSAVQFISDPEPDYVGREPESLPYINLKTGTSRVD
jgi:hypothetical protein